MNCWHCDAELIWGGDHDYEEEDGREGIVSNLSCPECEAFVLVYLPLEHTSP
jgi:hypothetical protein